jgi:hypothetical protein
VNGHITKPTKTELKAVRRAGKIAQQHLYKTVEVALGQATLQPETPPMEVSETVPSHPSAQRQEEIAGLHLLQLMPPMHPPLLLAEERDQGGPPQARGALM